MACYTREEFAQHGAQLFSWFLWLFGAFGMSECMGATQRKDQLHAGENDERVVGTAVWEKPIPTLVFVLRGLAFLVWYLLTFGLTKWILFIKLAVFLEQKRFEHGSTAHHLQFLGTLPACQGKGIGSQLIKIGIKRADNLNLPCYLESSNPKNVPFYKRHGFVVAEECYPLQKGSARGPAITLMIRKGRSE
jgi:ribosomal protein S18 acetylase RimI-like enzyme